MDPTNGRQGQGLPKGPPEGPPEGLPVPASSRWCRIERRSSLVLVALVGLYLILYGIGALILQSHVNHLLAQQLGVANTFRLSASAWPPGLALRANDMQFTTATQESGGAKTATIILPIAMPWRAMTVLQDVTYGNRYVRAAIDSVRSTTPLYARRLAQYHTEATALKVWPGAAPAALENALQVAALTVNYQRRLQQHDSSNPEEESTATLRGLTLPSGSADAQSLLLDRLTLRTTAEPAVPRALYDAAAMTAWRDAGGALNLAPLELEAFGTTSTLRGPLTLDANLVPAGRLTLTFTGLDKAYAALKNFNLMPAEQYALLGNFLKLMPQGGAAPFDFPVTIKEHAVFFLDGVIFELNRMPWEIAQPALPTDATPPPQLTPVPATPAPSAPALPPGLPLTPSDPALPPGLPLTPSDPALPLGDSKSQ